MSAIKPRVITFKGKFFLIIPVESSNAAIEIKDIIAALFADLDPIIPPTPPPIP